jgi:hypothetical protein
MNHTEAVEQMAAEKYLLDELAPAERDAFEDHAFDCPDCALDLRAGALFVHEAKIQLPGMKISQAKSERATPSAKQKPWLSWWRPAFSVPAFAALLIVVGYQNLVTFPALRQSAIQPQLVPVVPLRPSTRGSSARPAFSVDRAHGIALPIDLSGEPGTTPAASYSFDLRDQQGKLVWSSTIAAPAANTDNEQPYSLMIPGGALHSGSYSLSITSVSAQGVRTPIDQYGFDIVMTN